MSDWAHPDFSDARFSFEDVWHAARCCYDGCDRLAEYLVAYSERRGGWTYDYECGYCAEHLPPEALTLVDRDE